MAANEHLNPKQFPADYSKHYARGWSSSNRAANSDNLNNNPLERADMKGEPNSWYDGYHDEAAGRDKYETALYRHAPDKYKSHYGVDNPFAG